jgi:hypothetical protein
MERNFVLHDHVGSACYSLKEEGIDSFCDFASMEEAFQEIRCRVAHCGGTVAIVTWCRRSVIYFAPHTATS